MVSCRFRFLVLLGFMACILSRCLLIFEPNSKIEDPSVDGRVNIFLLPVHTMHSSCVAVRKMLAADDTSIPSHRLAMTFFQQFDFNDGICKVRRWAGVNISQRV